MIHPIAASFIFLIVAVIFMALAIAWGVTVLFKSSDNTTKTKSVTEQIAVLTEQSKAILERVQDCSSREGQCYKANQEVTKKAVQAILDGLAGQFAPHRLRNEAENLCQVYIFAGTPSQGGRPPEEAVALYKQCVLDRSGGTEAPPLPINPYATTTTTGRQR